MQTQGVCARCTCCPVPWAAVLLASLALFSPETMAQGTEGVWIKVPSPITGEAMKRIQNQTESAFAETGAKIVVYHFQQGDLSDFGPCSDLSDFIISKIQARAESVAYIEGPLIGHAVLPALSCKTVYMGPDAAIGFDRNALDKYGSFDGPKTNKYLQVAENRGEQPALIQKMLDAGLTVYQVDAPGMGRRYKLSDELTAEDRRHIPKVILNEGEYGLYTTSQALAYGLCDREFAAPLAVAEALQLPGSIIHGDPLAGQSPRPVWISVVGPLDAGLKSTVLRKIRRALQREEANVLIFEINSLGGDPVAASALAKMIQSITQGTHESGKQALTVAYIAEQASGVATFPALACGQIVMNSGARFGDFGSIVYSDAQGKEPRPADELQPIRETLINLAQEQGYPSALVQAMIDPNIVVVPVEAKLDPNKPDEGGPRRRTFLKKSEAELNEVQWRIIGPPVKEKGNLLTLNADNAVNWGVARHRVESASGVAAAYGLEEDQITHLRADWLDELVNVITHPATTILLVIVGFTCLILELKAPGLGLPILLAAVCFVLLFWGHSALSGEVNALAILLFVLGLILIGMEVFVTPGFGILGIGGVVLVLLSLSLVVVQQWPQSAEEYATLGRQTGTFAIGMVVSIICSFIIARFLPSIPYANRLVLKPPDEEVDDAAGAIPYAQPAEMLGAIGTALTTLRPAGRAQFDDAMVDVVAEGHYVDLGSRVQVIEIDGTRVIVKQV